MKKVICTLLSVLIMGTASFAQSKEDKNGTPAKAQTTNKATKAKEHHDTKANAASAKGEGKSSSDEAGKPAAKLKKDGTPDMRYKENKAAKPEVKLKKDGTPDKRYKANKDAAATK